MKKKILILIIGIFSCISCTFQANEDSNITQTQRITFNEGMSNSFTDLTYFNNQFFLAYRESDKHVHGLNGVIKIYTSIDGKQWKLSKEYGVDGTDLRDPKFAVNGNKLSIYLHGSVYKGTLLVEFKDFISEWSGIGWSNIKSLSLDNKKSEIAKVAGNESWPWRITWYKDIAYVFGYNTNGIFDFYTSQDGINFINKGGYFKEIGSMPTEATIRIDQKGDFYSLVRRSNGFANLLKSANKGGTWKIISEIPIFNLGGPNFLFYKNGLILSGRENATVVLSYFDLSNNKYSKMETLESGGDCSYPGMVIIDNYLWISYYSGHENNTGTSIYLSKVNLDKYGL